MVPTVFIVGESRLPLIPEYLNLGTVVVVAPDQGTLKRWTHEQEATEPPGTRGDAAGDMSTVVDLAGRRILHGGEALPLSDLEYRVLSALLSPPGRAISYRELRRVGWGETLEISADIYSVRALVQRLRAKLQVAHAEISIEAVRGYGLRAVIEAKESSTTVHLVGP
jgi:DNA-binding response OmpR family regulator